MNDRGERTIGAGPDLQTRLHRIDRRVHGLTRMIEAGRPAVEVLDQIAAIRGALLSLGVAIIAREVDTCLHAARTRTATGLDGEPVRRGPSADPQRLRRRRRS